jgi:CHAT domain-containing protein
VLITEKPERTQRLSDAAWLIKRHAITVVPSVASLRALRAFAKENRTGKPFIGFGDPVFQKVPTGPPNRRGQEQRVASNETVRGVSGYFRGAFGDVSALRHLAPLYDTADELKGIAASLGAPANELILGANASETAVKSLSGSGRLAEYRVVAFATHGLVAGDIQGLAEPALALTVPDEPTEADDGLLTASEVATLKLNADWVILSACNTAAGDKPGAEALSGLARAFFYAGARGLLVSHWQVECRRQAHHHRDRRTQGASRDRSGRGTPPGHARADAGQIRSSERPSGDLGTLYGGRRGWSGSATMMTKKHSDMLIATNPGAAAVRIATAIV